MATKLSDFLRKVLEPTGLASTDMEMVLSASALKEIEVPDTVEPKFSTYYMTKDRAMNDPDIVKSINRSLWATYADKSEEKIIPLFNHLPEDVKAEMKAIPKDEPNRFYKYIEILEKGVVKLKESGSTDDVKKASEKFRQVEAELRQQIAERDEAIKKKESDFQKNIQDVQLDYALRSKLSNFEFGEAYAKDEVKSLLIDSKIKSLKSNFVLEIDPGNPSKINLRQNKDGAIIDVYEGNKQVTLDDKLAKELEPYLKKSNGGAGGGEGAGDPPRRRVEVPTDKPLTLDQMRAKHAATGATA